MATLPHLNSANAAELLKRFPKNEIVINSDADFRVQDATTSTFEANTSYVIGDSFNTQRRFIVEENVVITGTVDITIAFGGVGVMFTSTASGGFFASRIRFISSTASQIFDFSNVSPGNSSFVLDKVVVSEAAKFGTLDQVGFIILDEVVSEDIDDGITLENAIGTIIVRTFDMQTTSATCVQLDLGTAVISSAFNINQISLNGVAGSVGMSGLTASGNIGTSIVGTIIGGNFPAPVTPLVNLSESDLRLEFFNSAPIPDSTKTTDTFLTASETAIISVAGTFVAIGGVNWSSDVSERFSTTTAGLATYLSPVDTKSQVSITATVEKVGGGSDLVELGIAINGTVVTKTIAGTKNKDPTSVTAIGVFTLTTNDTIQAFVANIDTTTNIVVSRSTVNVINGF